jgi:hypothetical protein
LFDRISITHAHFDAMNRKHFIPVMHYMRRLPRWAADMCLRENRMIAT